jgi:hypothetical protein
MHTCREKNKYISTGNPQPIHGVSFHVVNIAVWCAMTAREDYGPVCYSDSINSAMGTVPFTLQNHHCSL